MDSLTLIEQQLFSVFGSPACQPEAIFILGAPRTGSTVLYQAMASAFRLPFVSNFINEQFAATPIVGLAIQNGIPVDIHFQSAFGKTAGIFQPSEGSAVMSNWFGGGHPSQTMSTSILDGREAHFLATLAAVQGICQAPLLIKNAWHCFRVPYLAHAIRTAQFIWIRRDIEAAALSDLEARYLTKNDPNAWNSATPSNVEKLRQLPPAGQVLENQYEFNTAIETALRHEAGSRYLEVWYEDLLADTARVLKSIGRQIGRDVFPGSVPQLTAPHNDRRLLPDDIGALKSYQQANASRLGPHRYKRSG